MNGAERQDDCWRQSTAPATVPKVADGGTLVLGLWTSGKAPAARAGAVFLRSLVTAILTVGAFLVGLCGVPLLVTWVLSVWWV